MLLLCDTFRTLEVISLFLVSVSIISERCKRYCTNNAIFCDYNIINHFYDTHNYRWKSQKPEAGYNIGSVSVIGTYMYIRDFDKFWSMGQICSAIVSMCAIGNTSWAN